MYYPCTTHKIILVNPGFFVDMGLSIVKKLVNPITASKFNVVKNVKDIP